MTLTELLENVNPRCDHDKVKFARRAWKGISYVCLDKYGNLILCTKSGRHDNKPWAINHYELTANDWELVKDEEVTSFEDYDYGVYACVGESMDGSYTGFIIINTDDFECPKDAIDSIVAFAEEYELGFDASDIDLSEVLDTIGHKCEDES